MRVCSGCHVVETWGLPGGTLEAEAGISLALSAEKGVGMALILQVVTAIGEGWSERSFRQIRLCRISLCGSRGWGSVRRPALPSVRWTVKLTRL